MSGQVRRRTAPKAPLHTRTSFLPPLSVLYEERTWRPCPRSFNDLPTQRYLPGTGTGAASRCSPFGG